VFISSGAFKLACKFGCLLTPSLVALFLARATEQTNDNLKIKFNIKSASTVIPVGIGKSIVAIQVETAGIVAVVTGAAYLLVPYFYFSKKHLTASKRGKDNFPL